MIEGSLHNLYSSNIISKTESGRIRWDWHIACMGELYTKVQSENLKGRDHSGDPGTDNIRVDFIKWGLRMLTGFIWLKMGPMAGCSEHHSKPPGCVKGSEFLD
jgi:hypothetical protein